MPSWRLKSPGEFPIYFHEALKHQEPGHYEIWHYKSAMEAEYAAESWRLFLYCVRNWPAHPSQAFLNEPKLVRRATVKREKRAEGNVWFIRLLVRESTQYALLNAQVVEKPIDGLG